MSKHYKKLLLILIPACAGFCLALALGSAEEPSELTQERINHALVRLALDALCSQDVDRVNEYFNPDYLHVPPRRFLQSTGYLSLEETISLFSRFDNRPSDTYLHWRIHRIIAEGNSVVVFFDVTYSRYPSYSFGSIPYFVTLSCEVWRFAIIDGKIRYGWSFSDDTPHEENNKALVREAILAFDEDPWDANLPEQFDPNYVQHSLITGWGERPIPHFSGCYYSDNFNPKPVTFRSIIAEGDMVSVRLQWSYWSHPEPLVNEYYAELAIYRIANGKIVEGWQLRTSMPNTSRT